MIDNSHPAGASPGGDPERERHLALANGVRLMLSLFATLSVAVIVRFWLPRHLGPGDFGRIHFAESFAVLLLGLTGLGVSSYIGKEVSTRPSLANEFMGGMLLVRLGLTLVVAAIGFGVLVTMGKDSLDYQLVGLYLIWQAGFILNNNLSALLHSKGTVGELSIINVVAKIAWGVGIVTELLAGSPLIIVPVVFVATEVFRACMLFLLCRRHLGLRLQWNAAATYAAVFGSMPYFINSLAVAIYSRVDVAMISAVANDEAVGWYGAAAALAGIVALFIPLVQSVLLPMSARIAKAQGNSSMDALIQNAVRIVVAVSAGISIGCILNGKELVALLYGEAYGPALLPLQLLAATFPLTYVCVLAALQMVAGDRVWSVTFISLAALVLNPLLNYLALPYADIWFEVGGAGTVAAATTLATEIVVTSAFLITLGKAGPDRRFAWVLVKLAGITALLWGIHTTIPVPGLWRAPIEACVFIGVGTLTDLLPTIAVYKYLRERFG